MLPITGGALDLGPWEQVFYAEFDGQRRKRGGQGDGGVRTFGGWGWGLRQAGGNILIARSSGSGR
jgi:hypothetical protein